MSSMAETTNVLTNGAASSPPPSKQILEKLEFIEEMTTNVDAVQESVLAEILGRNAESEYLVKCGLAGATDRATFQAKVPIATYEDLKPYIVRVAHGDRSPILTGSNNPISEFFVSSGTSGGERKLIPIVKDEFDRRQLLESLIMPVMNKFVPGLDKSSGLYFLFIRSETTTPSGLPVRTIQTSYYKSGHFKKHPLQPYHACTSPTAAILCLDMFQSMYAQMVCGLCLRHDVLRIGTVFASGLVRAIQFFQQHWEQIATDIKTGELNSCVSDPSVREAVAEILRPDPDLAQFIRTECTKGDWAGIIRRVWPNTRYVDTIVTGSMAQYVPTLNYYSGDLPIASTKYVSSECSLGLNLRPLCDPSEVSYTILPNMAYFEFLPTDAAMVRAELLVGLTCLEAGREYEVVVTTYGGLNRYRMGDILRVTGFHNVAPLFRFVGRRNVVLSIDADKTDEAELQRAVERAAMVLRRRHGAAAGVLDYTSRACTTTIPGHYVIYWELLLDNNTQESVVDGGVMEMCCQEMEEALNYVYRQLRVEDGAIGPLEIRVVRPGTFKELADLAVLHGASIGQYKVPRCVSTRPDIIRVLDASVVSTHFSPSLPHWAPDHQFE